MDHHQAVASTDVPTGEQPLHLTGALWIDLEVQVLDDGLERAHVPGGPYVTTAEVADDPQVRDGGTRWRVAAFIMTRLMDCMGRRWNFRCGPIKREPDFR